MKKLIYSILSACLALIAISTVYSFRAADDIAPPPNLNITVNNTSFESYPCSYKVTIRVNYSPMGVGDKPLTKTYTIPTGASQVFAFTAPSGTSLGSINYIKAQPVGCTIWHNNLSLTGSDIRSGNCSNCSTNSNSVTFWEFVSLNNYNIWADLATGGVGGTIIND